MNARVRADGEHGLDALHDHVVARMSLPETIDWVATLAVEQVAGTEFAVIAMLYPDRHLPGPARATDPLAMDLFQSERAAADGPLLNTLATGTLHQVEQTTDPNGPWPEFCAASAEQGVLSILTLPLEVAGARIGGLGLYSEATNAYPTSRVDTAIEFAAAAAIVLTNAADFWAAAALGEQLAAALTSRAAIDQAKGILMHTVRCGPDEAFNLLVEQSKSENRKVRDIATELVAQTAAGSGRRQESFGERSGLPS